MAEKCLNSLVPRAGLEPACGCPRWILSPLRLPFRHLGISNRINALAEDQRLENQRLCPKTCPFRPPSAHLLSLQLAGDRCH
jgi:hypothetical protein